MRLAVVLALALCLWASTASAAPSLTVDLEVAEGDEPSHLCVVTRLAEPDQQSGRPVRLDELPVADAKARRADQTWTFDQTSRAALDGLDGSPVVRSALKALAEERSKSPSESCAIDREACHPSFVLSPSLQYVQNDQAVRLMHCAQNEPPFDDEGRVAVVFVDFHANNPPSVKNVQLRGTVASIELNSALKGNEFVVATVVGGHYALGSGHLSHLGRLRVPLRQRCKPVAMQLPPFEGTSRAICATADVQLRDRRVTVTHFEPVLPASGLFEMQIPASIPGSTNRVHVEKAKKTRLVVGEFVGSWTGPRPTDLELAASRISFTWERNCLYGSQEEVDCPTATIEALGHGCEEPVAVGERCHYVCPIESPAGADHAAEEHRILPTIAFTLPATVRFTSPNGAASWRLKLRVGHQVLRGFVPSADRHVTVDFSSWTAMGLDELVERPGYRIDYVEIHAPGRPRQRIVPDRPTHRVHVPGVLCNDSLSYQIVGEHSYLEKPKALEGAKLVLPPPQESMDEVVSLGAYFGGGNEWGYALGDVQTGSLPNQPLGMAQFVGALHALEAELGHLHWLARPTIELRVGVALTRRDYYFIRTDQPIDDERGSVWYLRYPVDLLAVYPAWTDFYFGLGIGAIVAHPADPDDQDLVGSLRGTMTLPLLIGYRIARSPVAVELSSRPSFFEQYVRHETDFRGSPGLRTTSGAVSWLVAAGVRIGR